MKKSEYGAKIRTLITGDELILQNKKKCLKTNLKCEINV